LLAWVIIWREFVACRLFNQPGYMPFKTNFMKLFTRRFLLLLFVFLSITGISRAQARLARIRLDTVHTSSGAVDPASVKVMINYLPFPIAPLGSFSNVTLDSLSFCIFDPLYFSKQSTFGVPAPIAAGIIRAGSLIPQSTRVSVTEYDAPVGMHFWRVGLSNVSAPISLTGEVELMTLKFSGSALMEFTPYIGVYDCATGGLIPCTAGMQSNFEFYTTSGTQLKQTYMGSTTTTQVYPFYGGFNSSYSTGGGVVYSQYTLYPGMNITPQPLVSLPISLGNFQLNQHILSWTMEDQSGLEKFVVEASSDGISFSPIASQPVNIHGSTYSQTIAAGNDIKYIRLRMMSNTGQSTYSKLLAVRATAERTAFSVYPNPVVHGRTITISLPTGAMNSTITAQLCDMTGRVLHQFGSFSGRSNNNQLTVVCPKLASGNYLLILKDAQHSLTSKIYIE